MMPPAVDIHDVAIILGARADADGEPSPAMRRRVSHGVSLILNGQARNLLMTGGATSGRVTEARLMCELARSQGIDASRIVLEERARNTIENALYSKAILSERNWRRALVVTDSFHLPRAWYVFRRLGVSVAMAAVRPATPSRQWWLAHGREIAALPWTILRVEALRIRPRESGG